MALYFTNIPPLAAVVNLHAQPLLAHITAPAIVAGTPHNGADLDRAVAEYRLRRALRTLGLVTRNELRQARTRMRAIEAEFAAAAFPVNPVGPGQALHAVVRQLHQRVIGLEQALARQERVVTNLDRFAVHTQRTLRTVRGIANRLRRGADNTESRVLNQIATDGAPANMMHRDIQLQPFISVDGARGTGVIPRPVRHAALPHLVAGAQIPSPPFPVTFDAIDTMRREVINDLSVLMDSNFGINHDDPIPTWRAKLRRFLTGQV